jgi:hypothetical protein
VNKRKQTVTSAAAIPGMGGYASMAVPVPGHGVGSPALCGYGVGAYCVVDDDVGPATHAQIVADKISTNDKERK